MSDQLLSRGAYIKKLSAGIFVYGPFLLRAIKKCEAIIREEMQKEGYEEILMPMVQPKPLWKKSGRWDLYSHLLQKFKSRSGGEFCLGPTHEEVVTEYAREHISSYKDLPLKLYQIQNKYRDEIRPRFALLRAKEFLMKDAYSFDKDEACARESYKKMYSVYTRIFKRVGVPFKVVKADSGEIGGDLSEEFHILAGSGEDELLVSQSYAANKEVCPCPTVLPRKWDFEKIPKPSPIFTPGLKTVDQLSQSSRISVSHLVKTLLLKSVPVKMKKEPKVFAVLLRAADEINLLKVKKHLHLDQVPAFLSVEELKGIDPAPPAGYVGPLGLSCDIYLDQSLYGLDFFITGANKTDHHSTHVVPGRDFSYKGVMDFRYAKVGDLSPQGESLSLVRGIEVGHIFYLGKKYSKSLGVGFIDQDGKSGPIHMGCYGIGVTRTVQAVVESSYDKDGVIWPVTLAPFLVHVCLLDKEDNQALDFTKQFYDTMRDKKISCFVDDRPERPGVKFKDADLLGFPLRVTVGSRDLKNDLVEVVERKGRKIHKVKAKEVSSFISSWFSGRNME